MTLKQLLKDKHYPTLSEFVERLKVRANAVHSQDSVEAEQLLDEIKHLAVRAFKPLELPE